jgi:bacteriocin biosynthesis cyclodehydratase domain-containing protein
VHPGGGVPDAFAPASAELSTADVDLWTTGCAEAAGGPTIDAMTATRPDPTTPTAPTPPHPPPDPDELPALLGLRPHQRVFPLGPGARFVGLDPDTAVVVAELPPALAAMLDELDVPTPRDQLVERAVARGAGRPDALALLAELLRAGTVVDAGADRLRGRRRAEATVLVRGDGPLTVGVATGLAAAGVGTVHVRTTGTVLATDIGTGLGDADRGRLRADAVAQAVRAVDPAVVTGRPPARFTADLVVLTDALLPEPALLAALLAARTAHLPVRLRDGAGVVGPLVLPGRTTCLRCLELHRRARDPAWPIVAAQLVGKPGRADPACAVATAALGTAQALAALDGAEVDGAGADGGAPPVVEATLEVDPTAGTLVRRHWPAHPDCGCGAAGRPGADP